MLNKILLDKITEEVKELLIKKNTDYGDSYFQLREEFGPLAFIVRLADKVGRLKVLASQKAQVAEESEVDTIKDIIGYCLLELYFRKHLNCKSE
ncbi:nucleotide modification associated domain-containing protein [Thermodesulfovibrio yellowstonii]|uniref:nucleotide modification associated domain-containing protein n=1 Tax=Thermodesulfovibrio yellowstonii TaxID=28262 RepID=UPI000421ECA6|nr:nucleotide modification associated domain-containing protein [Thermodesulfovibrio islandicus]